MYLNSYEMQNQLVEMYKGVKHHLALRLVTYAE